MVSFSKSLIATAVATSSLVVINSSAVVSARIESEQYPIMLYTEKLDQQRITNLIIGSSFEFQTHFTKIFTISSLFGFESKDEEIHRFLEGNPQLLNYVIESKKVLNAIFDNAVLNLRLSVDPDEGTQTLFIVINYNETDSSQKLERFDEEWFLDKLPACAGKLNFQLA